MNVALTSSLNAPDSQIHRALLITAHHWRRFIFSTSKINTTEQNTKNKKKKTIKKIKNQKKKKRILRQSFPSFPLPVFVETYTAGSSASLYLVGSIGSFAMSIISNFNQGYMFLFLSCLLFVVIELLFLLVYSPFLFSLFFLFFFFFCEVRIPTAERSLSSAGVRLWAFSVVPTSGRYLVVTVMLKRSPKKGQLYTVLQ